MASTRISKKANSVLKKLMSSNHQPVKEEEGIVKGPVKPQFSFYRYIFALKM